MRVCSHVCVTERETGREGEIKSERGREPGELQKALNLCVFFTTVLCVRVFCACVSDTVCVSTSAGLQLPC